MTRLVDMRERTGWAALRDAFSPRAPRGGRTDRACARHRSASRWSPTARGPDAPKGFAAFWPRSSRPHHDHGNRYRGESSALSPRPSSSRFARAGLPSPKQYLALAKLVRAAYPRRGYRDHRQAISERLQASSPQIFGRTVRHMTGHDRGRNIGKRSTARRRWRGSCPASSRPTASMLCEHSTRCSMRPATRERQRPGGPRNAGRP